MLLWGVVLGGRSCQCRGRDALHVVVSFVIVVRHAQGLALLGPRLVVHMHQTLHVCFEHVRGPARDLGLKVPDAVGVVALSVPDGVEGFLALAIEDPRLGGLDGLGLGLYLAVNTSNLLTCILREPLRGAYLGSV